MKDKKDARGPTKSNLGWRWPFTYSVYEYLPSYVWTVSVHERHRTVRVEAVEASKVCSRTPRCPRTAGYSRLLYVRTRLLYSRLPLAPTSNHSRITSPRPLITSHLTTYFVPHRAFVSRVARRTFVVIGLKRIRLNLLYPPPPVPSGPRLKCAVRT